MFQQLDKIKEKTLPILVRNNVKFAGIFGSQARGEAQADSDLDMLIKLNQPKSLLALVKLENSLSAVLGQKVDLITEKALSPYIKDSVFNDLQIFYGEK